MLSAAAADGPRPTRPPRCSRPPASTSARARRDDLDEALQAASAIGYPVALKALGPTLLHKTEARAVCLNIADAAAVCAPPTRTSPRGFGDEMTSVLVQQMVPPGVEMIVGARSCSSS